MKTITAPGLYLDGGGLFLQVAPGGSRSWVYKWKVSGRQRSIGLGSATDVKLAEARLKAKAATALRVAGVDPLAAKRAAKEPQKPAPDVVTFEMACETYLAKLYPTLTNAKHRAQWRSTLFTHAVPAFGHKAVTDVTLDDVAALLAPIWAKTPETASRLRGRIEIVIRHALPGSPNPATQKDIKVQVPRSDRSVKHHAYMPFDRVAAFVGTLRADAGLPALAFELLILTAVRTKELLCAERDEFDLDAALWTIPASRMKIKDQDHRVPLSPRAVEVVRLALQHRRGDEPLLFPGRKIGRPFSDMVFLMILRRARLDVTGHGFRTSFKSWAAELTAYPDLLSEMALAHHVGSEVRRAYQRSDLLEKRRVLMNDWASFIEPPIADGA